MSSSSRLTMLLAAGLCVAVAAVHVDDQGGVTALTGPNRLGWAYRLLEVGALVVAGALVFAAGAASTTTHTTTPRTTVPHTTVLWLVVGLIGSGPSVGYVLSRTTGLPGDADDVGNWGEPLGVVSLAFEAALILLAVAGLVAARTRPVVATTESQQHELAV